MSWFDEAACKGENPDIFFPTRGEYATAAKAICAGCPVADDCLEYALAIGAKHGVWGGLSEHQRRTVRAARPRRQPAERWDPSFEYSTDPRSVYRRQHRRLTVDY